ncbi:hypothetical protein L210DRAFT_3768844 [Boletus edulis BED1]|uniref:Uncharacterized protein n=1 Tax=Boletus edulis BED1 TaxID=1328754 RepID=A0AAD4G4W0_BOLED|nr:hypothetical protein L210DRAFT_3768844 [Boletus edulis BED1]
MVAWAIFEGVRSLLVSCASSDKPGWLSNIGSTPGRLEKLGDLEQAISRHKEAVDLTSSAWEVDNLKQAASNIDVQDALDLTPGDHPNNSTKPEQISPLSQRAAR